MHLEQMDSIISGTLLNHKYICRAVASGGGGVYLPPQFTAEQLTLSQQENKGGEYAHQITTSSAGFQTLRRPWYVTPCM